MTTRRITCAIVLGVIATSSAPSAASAIQILRSYQGADYSTNSSGGLHVYACDEENDGHDVSADYVEAGSSTERHVIDGSGPDGHCARATLSHVVYKHRAVELLPLTDAYGPWVYPT